MPSDIPIPITLRPGRKAHVAIVVFFVVMTIAAVYMANEDGRPKGYWAAGVVGCAALFFAVALHPKAYYLHLAHDAFTYVFMFRTCTVRWEHVLELGLVSLNGVNKVAWHFTPDYPGRKAGGSQLKAQTGFDETLPNNYGLSAEELYALMERLRLECLLRQARK